MAEENKGKFNLDYTFNLAKNNLKNKSPELVCEKTGAIFDSNNQAYEIPYLHTRVSVTLEGQVEAKEKELTLQEKILIIHYLSSDGSDSYHGQDKLISFKELPGGEIYLGPFTNRAVKPFLKIFASSPEMLDIVAEKWNGQLAKYGDKSISLAVLPDITVCYILWLGDEEFPANATILFNHNIIDFFTTEDVAVLVSQLVYQMPGLLG
jgi:hypothetical protein